MFKVLQKVKKNLAIAIPVTMILGLAMGTLVDTSAFKVAILPLTILMIYPMMVALNFKSLASGCILRDRPVPTAAECWRERLAAL